MIPDPADIGRLVRCVLGEEQVDAAMTTVRWGGASDIGRCRQANEDAQFARVPLFVVADGVGGHAGGAEASRLAVAEFERLAAMPTLRASEVHATVARANQSILDAASANPGWAGMSTTIVGLALVDGGEEPHLLVFNVGDSRAYRLAGEALEQLTVDHAVGNELTRALGTVGAAEADYCLLRPTAGERFLLCSDGLTRELTDAALRTGLAAPNGPDQVARDLVAAAVAAGGRDNVSAVVVEVLA